MVVLSNVFTTIVAAEGGGSVFGNLGINPVLIIAQIINLLLLVLLLNLLVFKPLMGGIEARRQRAEDSLENARKADERLSNVEKDYQAKLKEADAEAQKLRGETMQAAQVDADRVRKDAVGEADKIREQARIDALAARNQALADVRPQVAALAMAAAGKLVGESLSADKQKALINDFFTSAPDLHVDAGAVVTVTSAVPLSADEQAGVEKRIGASNVAFAVDPGILGGLVVRVGDKVVDGSVSSKMSALKNALNA